MIKKTLIILAALSTIMSCENKTKHESITMNLYYTGVDGKARKFAEEMESSGTADAIRAEEGNLRYEYFFPADDPETVLLVDSWTSQEALDIHHATPMMETITSLREKYDLTMKAERYYMAEEALTVADKSFIRTKENNIEPKTVDFTVWPKGEVNPYGQFFTGNSYLADLGSELFNVTFEPGCRNNWHIHHKQVQVLICIAGHGWYQEWGKEPVEMKPGVVIFVPEGVKHWHGATKDSWFQHLTYHMDAQEDASNEWLENVSDNDYNKL